MDTKKIETAIASIVARTLLEGAHKRTASVASGSSSATFGVPVSSERVKYYLVTEAELRDAMVAKLDFFELSKAVIETILSEENTDDLIEVFLDRVSFPWYVPKRLVRSQLDKRLPEVVRDPLLGYLEELEAKTGGGG